jgi:glycosyltransferase involved in cell wall biosynthesis
MMAVSRESPMVIIPAYNEEGSVGVVARQVLGLGYRAVVVDDGSVDRTAAVAEEAGAVVLRSPVNLGVGGALRLGFRFALEQGATVVVQCDADGQHLPAEIPLLLEAIDEGADMVVGTRFAGPGSMAHVRRTRRFAMRILARLASRAAGGRITDSTSGFRAIRRPLLDAFAVSYPAEYLGDTVEALIEAGRSGYRIAEVPITISPREHGRSSASWVANVWYLTRVVSALGLRAGRRMAPPVRVAAVGPRDRAAQPLTPRDDPALSARNR